MHQKYDMKNIDFVFCSGDSGIVKAKFPPLRRHAMKQLWKAKHSHLF